MKSLVIKPALKKMTLNLHLALDITDNKIVCSKLNNKKSKQTTRNTETLTPSYTVARKKLLRYCGSNREMRTPNGTQTLKLIRVP